MKIEIKVTLDLEFREGKFAPKDELLELAVDELDGILDGSELYCANDGRYEIVATEAEAA